MLEAFSYIVVIVTFCLGIIQYRENSKNEQREREERAYDEVDDKYLEFLQICMANPSLDIFDIEDKEKHNLSLEDKKKELIAFAYLLSVFERAYLSLSEGQDDEFKNNHWAGWEAYIKHYCCRKNFRHAAYLLADTFETKFCNQLKRYLADASGGVSNKY